MSFLDTVERAKSYLERQGRVSLRALKREFGLDDAALGELVEELVEVQSVAVRDGKVLVQSAGVAAKPPIAKMPMRERAPREYTPKHLADKILQSKSALEGERKHVTVLFADVKGSMELAEQVDPEEWHKILDRFFQILTESVHRFEGTVNQYTGDGIMALFGAPIAHEDHAQRACRAALTLRDRLRSYAEELRVERGLNFSVRMGLNSGDVVVGRIGTDLRMDYTAQGATVGLAQRMEQLAESGQVYLTERTAELVAGFFRTRDLGPSRIKGIAEPVRVHQLEGRGRLTSRFELSRARGLLRFVGRDDEMAFLECALERALAGDSAVVAIEADAGVGKSRLCFEFMERCRSRGIQVITASCAPWGRSVPLSLQMDMQRSLVGITERDDDQTARTKVAGVLALFDPPLTRHVPRLLDMLGLGDPTQGGTTLDAETRQRLFLEFITDWTRARGSRPLVGVLEDLHWVDEASEATFAAVAAIQQGTPTLNVVNFRPEYHPAPEVAEMVRDRLVLRPLSDGSIGAIVHDLLGDAASDERLMRMIQERTRGNPFFAEEIVQSLVESGHLEGSAGGYRLARPVDSLAIPASVEAVLAARIDRLDETAKAVLRTAAVVGTTVRRSLLERIAELSAPDLARTMEVLGEAQFIHEETCDPEIEYAFRHPLTQEVAYRSQLGDRRRCTHGEVASALQEVYATRLDEKAALIAHHWEAAAEPLEAARWHCRAAKWAEPRDRAAAHRHWLTVRTLLRSSVPKTDAIDLDLAACIGILRSGYGRGMPSKEVDEVFADGKALALRHSDGSKLTTLVAHYDALRMLSAPEAMEAARLAESASEPAITLAKATGAAPALVRQGPVSEGLRVAEVGLAAAARDPELSADPRVMVLLLTKGLALRFLGRFQEARRVVDEVRKEASVRTPGRDIGASALQAEVAASAGEGPEAVREACRALDMSEDKDAWMQVFVGASLARAYGLTGDWAAAAEAAERALALATEKNTALWFHPLLLTVVALARARRGDALGARRAADQAIRAAQQDGSRVVEAYAKLALAEVLLGVEGEQSKSMVEAALGEAQALVEATGAVHGMPFIHERRGELARVCDDEATRQRELREAHRLFTEMGATGHAERLAKELGL